MAAIKEFLVSLRSTFSIQKLGDRKEDYVHRENLNACDEGLTGYFWIPNFIPPIFLIQHRPKDETANNKAANENQHPHERKASISKVITIDVDEFEAGRGGFLIVVVRNY